MIDSIEKHKDILLYIIFGICTTLVNMVVYWFCAHILHLFVVVSTVISWVISVLFAYVTNRKYVFHSKKSSYKDIVKEMFSFFSCRFLTGLLDVGFMFIFVDLFHMNDMIIKIVSNIIVIVLNYVASKIFIFKK